MTIQGGSCRVLSVVDEYIREVHALHVAHNIGSGKVLEVVEERTKSACGKPIAKALPGYCGKFKIKAVAVDMWPAFGNTIRGLLPNASVVYDRFHISGYLCGAVDQVRRAEHKQLLKDGGNVLTGAR